MYWLMLISSISVGFVYTGELEKLPEHVEQITELNTCNEMLIEQVLKYVLERYPDRPDVQEQILRSISSSCIGKDELIALAIGIGIDLGAILTGLDVPTSTGKPGIVIPSPGDTGPGGGTGSGDGNIVSRN